MENEIQELRSLWNKCLAPEKKGFFASCFRASLRDVRVSYTTLAQIHS